MPPRRDPVPRARAAGHWLGGILLLGLLGGAVVAAAILLWENLDVRQLTRAVVSVPGALPEPAEPVAPAVAPGGFDAALFTSGRNAEYFPDTSYYPRSIRRWSRLVEDGGGRLRTVESVQDLRGLGPDELLVLPEAPCLSSAEVAAIRAHLRRGGSLVADWAVGARDQACAWRGWQTVAEFTGAGDVRELAVREALFMTVPGATPLSPGLDPGTRIELRPEPSLALFLPGPRVYWSDWALNPAPDESGGGADVAAVATRTDHGGRVSWFGFRLSQAVTPRDSVRLERMVLNGILWGAGKPVASLAPWPEGRRAALLLVEDVEAEFENSLAMAGLLQEMNVPGTFFVVSQLVMDDPGLADALGKVGEIGSQTSDHTPVAGLGLDEQRVRLRRSWTEIRGWTGTAPDGLRPPEEAFDNHTVRAWGDLGGQYLLAVNQARSASPELYPTGDSDVVLLPRLIKDDYNVFVQDGALRTARLTEAFIEGTDKLRAMGGLAVVAVHTQIVGTGGRLDAVRDVANHALAQGDWWITTAGDVAAWWAQRSQVRITYEASVPGSGPQNPDSAPGPSRATSGTQAGPNAEPDWDLRVQAPATSDVRGLWVSVLRPDRSLDLVPYVDGVPVTFAATDWGFRVPLGDLRAGAVVRISLRPPVKD